MLDKRNRRGQRRDGMTALEQLEKWVAGENVHDKERDECCPDFACCQPNNHFS
jgi:hypothetical protein